MEWFFLFFSFVIAYVIFLMNVVVFVFQIDDGKKELEKKDFLEEKNVEKAIKKVWILQYYIEIFQLLGILWMIGFVFLYKFGEIINMY